MERSFSVRVHPSDWVCSSTLKTPDILLAENVNQWFNFLPVQRYLGSSQTPTRRSSTFNGFVD